MAEINSIENTTLKAGLLEMIYEKGSIRRISIGNTEIVRMIYSAVRDRNWGTIEPVILDQKIELDNTSFDISLQVAYKADPIHFIADYHIKGGDNTILFEMNGTALSDFLKNRIGFCILHPIRECVGKTATVIHSEGNTSEFIFPEVISPYQPVKNIQSMSWEPQPGITARIDMKGDIFEMEDQRNWTDASYKTYCTPLELPFPALIKKGETVSQVIELTVETTGILPQTSSELSFTWDQSKTIPFPSLGTSVSSREERLTSSEINLLEKLPLKHLRVEIQMANIQFITAAEKAIDESERLGWPLFIVLYLSDNYQEEYIRFNILFKPYKDKVGWILPVGPNHLPLPAFDDLYPQIKNDFPQTMVGTGVNAYFAELNRARPSIKKADFVSFTISPQVHAFDNASLIENLEAQGEVIHSAKSLFPHKPIFVSPVSLRQRFNVVATAAEPSPLPGQLPLSVDIRQRTNFAALWTLGSLKYLSQAGAQLITYYETVGWKGWIQGEQLPSEQTLFQAQANEIFPVYTVLKKLSGYTHMVHSVSSHPLIFDGLMLTSNEKMKCILFNFTDEDIEIRLEPEVLFGSTLFDSSKANVRIKANNWVEISRRLFSSLE
ncbi:MAG TPA: hypothetical protein VK205_07450 [Prolixibacteraceae bacterium]|nr:hypothetical protein [Prolixibacteraceae bacterium]